MTHLHSDHRSHVVYQRAPAVAPFAHLVNAPVSLLDFRSSALILTHHPEQSTGSPLVVEGEVITDIATIPARTRDDTDATSVPEIEPTRNLLRRLIDDPYWILMTLLVTIGLAMTATVIYGVIQITLTVAHWLHANGTTIAGILVLITLLMICGGASAAKCAGIHCGGCTR
ncbi:MAG: hypothetical protein WAL99_00655 [Pseudonocardiaceae bacterium]